MAYKERYQDLRKQAAYENACDCRYFGMGSKDWVDCGLSKPEREEVWKLAFWDMAEPDCEHGKMVGDRYVFSPSCL